MKLTIAAICAGLMLVVSPTSSDVTTIGDGTAAFDRGDYAASEKLLLPLAERGAAPAQAIVGTMYLTEKLAGHDAREGLKWLRRAASQDDATAEGALGMAYLSGLGGLQQDLKVAAMWFQAAARHPGRDSADAQFYLGRLYAGGSGGLAQSRQEAQKWYALAASGFEEMAAKGLLRAKLKLASMYAEGEGVSKDQAKAGQLYREVAAEYARAAERGDPTMQVKLADLYTGGLGVSRDEAQAYIWMRRAADQGDPTAIVRLGMFYMKLNLPKGLFDGAGLTDPANVTQSYIWLKLASIHYPHSGAQGLQYATDQVLDKLSDAQKAEAEMFIRTWRPVKEASTVGGSGPLTAVQASELRRLESELE